MNDKICSFFGHRDVEITEKLYDITYVEILNAIELGCRTFYFGGYGDFDGLCFSKLFMGRRQWQPTPVLLPEKSHGRKSLVGCSPWGR